MMKWHFPQPPFTQHMSRGIEWASMMLQKSLTRNERKFHIIPTGINIGKYNCFKTSAAKYQKWNIFNLAIMPSNAS